LRRFSFTYRVCQSIFLLWVVPVAIFTAGGAPLMGGSPFQGGSPSKEAVGKPTITDLEAIIHPWYKYRADGKPGREVTLVTKSGKLQGNITLLTEYEGRTETIQITQSIPADSISLLLPAHAGVEKEAQVHITLRTATQDLFKTLMVPAGKQWTVYIYPHAHVDIGYTALQETVQQLHVRNIDVGIDIARKTKDYPIGARFVWNPEATWVIDHYWQQANAQQKRSFIEAVQKGWVRIDAAHSNLNTSICSDEELMQVFTNSDRFAGITGVPVTTMVQMDVPGGSWGLVQAAAQHGIKGFISFPNYYDLRYTLENKPFYWVAPDGKSKLFFLQAVSYGAGYRIKGSKYGLGKIQRFTNDYDRLSTNNPLANFIDPFIFEETARLEKEHSLYDIFAMTWSMADNCLIDADLPEAVQLWNKQYAYPKMVIAGAKEIVDAYEEKYKNSIPEYKGDFTEYWTEGLGADARRVAMGRRGKENLVQAAALNSMLNLKRFSPSTAEASGKAVAPQRALRESLFDSCWENLLLAAEHTWGYQDPAAPMAHQVEATKAGYFENAEKISHELITQSLQSIEQANSASIAVINTLSWSRNGLVTLTAAQSRAGDRVVDEEKKPVLSQRLTTGELVFQATNIPALGSKLYYIIPGKNEVQNLPQRTSSSLRNEQLAITLDEQTGNVKSLIQLSNNRQLVDSASPFAINSYYHLPGVFNGKDIPLKPSTTTEVTVRVKEKGSLVNSLLVTAQATGCNWLTREVKLTSGQPIAELINTFDKTVTREKEGIHFGFAFNIPGGNTRIDIPWGIMRPEYDQLPGANRNWLTCQRWIDISNKNYGITWTCLEAPVVELGGLSGNILDGARQSWRWIKNLQPTQTIISWPVNNHWDTNFPLQQAGIITCSYKVMVHDAFDVVQSARFGMEQSRPLIAVPVAVNPIPKAIVSLDNPKVMISYLKKNDDDRSFTIRLRSVSDQPETVAFSWPAAKPKSVLKTINLLPYGTYNLQVTF
jgi:alpha-mannosidase